MKGKLFSVSLLIASAVLITVTGIVFRQSALRIAPLYVSLVVGLLQTRASRFAYLLGGLNCLLHTAAGISMGLYASAASALLFSCPLQLVTFWRWGKKSYKHSTEFHTLKVWQWLVGGAAVVIAFSIMQFALGKVSSHPVLDNLGVVLGLAVSLLSLLSFREYSWIMLVTGSLSVYLYILMTIENPAQSTYLIYATHSMICVVAQFFSVQKLYAEQKKSKTDAGDAMDAMEKTS